MLGVTTPSRSAPLPYPYPFPFPFPFPLPYPFPYPSPFPVPRSRRIDFRGRHRASAFPLATKSEMLVRVGLFNRSVRVLACPNCTAPLDVSPDGGVVACGYCGVQTEWASRGDVAVPRGPELTEADRLDRLERQLGRDEPPPDAAAPFLRGGDDAAVRQAAERALADARGAGDETLVYWITVALYNAYAGPENARKQRAVIESVAEGLRTPRPRQLLYAMMTRNAARGGDLPGAAQWFALLDPRSADLPMDSAYRLTRAYLATVQGAFADVHAAVGDRLGDVCLAGGDMLMSATLRANAHERLGDMPAAVRELEAVMTNSPLLAGLVRRIVGANPTLALCPQSLEVARAEP